MHSHIAILDNSNRPLALKPDTSFDVTEQNPTFYENEMSTYPVALPTEGNRHLLKNMDDVNADVRAVDVETDRMHIILEGIPFRSVAMIVEENTDVKDSLSVNFATSKRSFKDLISDLNCREIPIKDKLKIGEKIGNVEAELVYQYHVRSYDEEGHADKDVLGLDGDEGFIVKGTFDPQALGFSYPAECVVDSQSAGQIAKPGKPKTYPDGTTVQVPQVKTSFINVSHAYGETDESCPYPGKTWPFFNSRVCYPHYGKEEDGDSFKTSDTVVPHKDATYTNEDFGPLWVLDANRPQSGVCFYVLYFLDCLFAHLGMSFDKSALMQIEDLKHLAFFTTHCKYTSEEIASLPTLNAINLWLSSRGCGGQLTFENAEKHEVESIKIPYRHRSTGEIHYETISVGDLDEGVIHSIEIESSIKSYSAKAKIMAMYATSDNFPDMSVTEVIESLENAFGIRFTYDSEMRKVTAYLLRDVFQSNEAPIQLKGEVLEMVPVTEKITGVKQFYSAESDSKEQRENVRTGKRDYNTDFDYIDYPTDGRTVLNKTYAQIFTNRSSDDMNVYVDLLTGNAYRIKVNADATEASELNPNIFEVGTYKGVEIGDCSTENEDYIKEFSIGFEPVGLNDVNYHREAQTQGGPTSATTGGGITVDMSTTKQEVRPMLVPFVSEDMEHEFLEKKLRSVLSSPIGDFYLTEVLTLAENYDPTKTETGNSPLQDIDWGASVIMMRGGGTDATVQNYDYNYDLMGNWRWRTVAGIYAVGNDTIDPFGNTYDYNGTQQGDGGGERFSLKLRAYKPFRYKFIDGQYVISREKNLDASWLVPCQAGLARRGIFDTFMYPYAYFLLYRKKYKVKALVEAAQLVDIPNKWQRRFVINGKIGFIDKLHYSATVEKGIGVVEIDFLSL